MYDIIFKIFIKIKIISFIINIPNYPILIYTSVEGKYITDEQVLI